MILWLTAAFTAFFVKGLCGFANTLVFTSLMAFGESNRAISPAELLVGYPANFVMAWRGREKLDRRTAALCSLFMILGALPGALFLKTGDVGLIRVFFGFVVILTGIEMALRGTNTERKKADPLLLTVTGIISGVLCGLFGVGALMAAYVERTSEDMDSFRATISAVFFVENTMRIAIYLFAGILTAETLKLALLLLPAAGFGLFSGIRLSDRIDAASVRRVVIILLVLSGVSMIAMNL